MPDPAPAGLDPLPNRFTRATALGCLGILGVLALPILLLLPLESWHLPPWVLQLLELVAFLAMAGGIWLLSRVPAARPSGGADPRHPLTRAGRSPLIEQPAGAGNRLALLAILALALGILGLYVAAASFTGRPAFAPMVAVVGTLGALIILLGAAIALQRVPVPAWRWMRTSLVAPGMPQGLATSLLGAAAVGWSLLAAAGAGYTWGRAGLLLILISVLLMPFARRWPARRYQRRDSGREGADPTGQSTAEQGQD